MEKDLYHLGKHLKITEEVQLIDAGEVKINGKMVVLGKGFHHIFRIKDSSITDTPITLRHVRFVTKTLAQDETYQRSRVLYMRILCKSIADPLNNLITKFEQSVAV